jgi:diguanylate cyclase (GGDEF)-like protein
MIQHLHFQIKKWRNSPLKLQYNIEAPRTVNSEQLEQIDDGVVKKIESLLRLLEHEESKYARLKNHLDKTKSGAKKAQEQLKKVQNENKNSKKRIMLLQEQIGILNDMLEGIQKNYQISAEASVDLLSDLEYNIFKSRFVDIDIEYSPSIDKLKEYGKNIKGFFLDDMHCTYIYIHCNGITEDLQNLLHINISRKQKDSASFLFDRSKVYYSELEDIDLPERKLGRIIIGRYPYKSREKENSFDKRIKAEILMTRRLLEKCILEIQNKELAIKDALTGLHSRKFLIERLTEEFNSMDLFTRLSTIEYNVLKIIMKSEGVAGLIIKNQYFAKYKTKDDVVFNKALHKLKTLNVISTDNVKYAGEWCDCYFFESSKMSYELYLAILDIDHFKDVNDNWGGHAVGDRVLRDFAEILKKNIRLTDIPVRYGGEEFIIIFPRSSNYSRIFDVLENIRIDCERKLSVSLLGKKRNITVSIGVTQINKFDRNIHYIINRADAALYKAKKKRNRIIMCMQDNNGELKYS